MPDPNTFGGPLKLRRRGEDDWQTVELTRPFQDNARGIGLADMLDAAAHGGPHRASGELAYHVLDVMHTILEAAEQERTLPLGSRAARPGSPQRRAGVAGADPALKFSPAQTLTGKPLRALS